MTGNEAGVPYDVQTQGPGGQYPCEQEKLHSPEKLDDSSGLFVPPLQLWVATVEDEVAAEVVCEAVAVGLVVSIKLVDPALL